MNPVERSMHPSPTQVEALVQSMERNPSLAKGYLRTASARESAHRHWQRLSIELNSMGGAIKTWKQWAKYWTDKKSAVKKKGMLRSVARRRTGGGNEVVELSEMEEKILSLMGGEGFSVGDQHLAIQPFHDSPPVAAHALPTGAEVFNVTESEESLDPLSQIVQQDVNIPQTAYVETISQQIETISERGEIDVPVTSMGSSTSTATIFDTRRRQSEPQELSPPEPVAGPSRPASRRRRLSPPLAPSMLSPPPLRSPARRTYTTPRRNYRRRLVAASPPSQRRSQLTSLSERFLRVEEQRVEAEMINAQWRRETAESDRERDRMLISTLTRIGEALTEYIRRQ